MTLQEYRERIKPLNYVVQRNWEKDPYSEGDLDLFVALEDWDNLLQITQEANLPFKVDIRTHGDHYYPEPICDMLLSNPEEVDGWKVPNIHAHFFSLMYHSLVHKPDHPYKDKLNRLFLSMFPAVRADDTGVGFYA